MYHLNLSIDNRFIDTLAQNGHRYMRDARIDILRFLGLSLIILAHVYPPQWLFQLRNFDVPLMVLVSGLAFTHSKSKENYPIYVWNRIKRLVFPVWLFLTAYFLVVWLLNLNIEKLSQKIIIDSYLLLGGIGFVWIIRVFLLVALATPLLTWFDRSITNNAAYLVIVAAIYLLYEALIKITGPYPHFYGGRVISSFIYYLITYSLLFCIGIRIPKLEKNLFYTLIGLSFMITLILGIHYYNQYHYFIQTQEYKYPPRAYYLCYALLLSILSWLAVGKIEKPLQKLSVINSFIMFAARNSIWIYLWHIPFVKYFEVHRGYHYMLKYLVIYSIAAFITYIQVSLVNKKLLPSIETDSTRKNLRTLLTG